MVKKNTSRAKSQNAQRDKEIRKILGQGNYFTDLMSSVVPKGTFARFGGKGGGALGGQLAGRIDPLLMNGGSKMGGKAGRWMGEKIANLVGFGDYAVSSNSLSTAGKAIQPGEPVPQFGTDGARTRIKHREYIADILVPTNPTLFSNTTYAVNPGNASTFPWLSTLANNYQQYKFHGLIFEFVSTTSEVSAGGPMGSVILASNYDVKDVPFTSKINMENSQFAVSAKPSCSQIHTMECERAQTAANLLYVENDVSHVGEDPRWCDLANFQLATQGLPGTAGQVLGELWASYDIELLKPEISPYAASAMEVVAGVGPILSSWAGPIPTITGSAFFTVTNNTFTCVRPGTYLFEFGAACTVPVAISNAGTATYVSQVVVAPLATTTTFMQSALVTALPGQTVIVSVSTWGSIASSVTRITRAL
jgi:hypothetical protein